MFGSSKKMMTDDEMKSLSDIDLRRKYRDVIERIEEDRQNNRSSKDLEIEMCYLHREIECRRRWRENHRPEKMSKNFVGRPYRPTSDN